MEATDNDIEIEYLPESLKVLGKRWRYFTECMKYIISHTGDIWSYHSNKILKHSLGLDGYMRVNIFGEKHFIHRLVYEAYIEKIVDGLVIDHKNRNRTDNDISNLRMVTISENAKNSTPKSDVEITRIKGEEIVVYSSIELAIEGTPGSSRNGINRVCNGERKTHAGYMWKRSVNRVIVYHNPDSDEFEKIGEFEGVDYQDYEINKQGVVRKILKDNKRLVIKQFLSKGYMSVRLNKRNVRLHRLIAHKYCVHDNPEDNIVNHRNSNKLDNRVENLEWVTIKENTLQAIGKEIKSIDIITGEEKYYRSISQAAEELNVLRDTIGRVCRGIRHSAYGRYWVFVKNDLKNKNTELQICNE